MSPTTNPYHLTSPQENNHIPPRSLLILLVRYSTALPVSSTGKFAFLLLSSHWHGQVNGVAGPPSHLPIDPIQRFGIWGPASSSSAAAAALLIMDWSFWFDGVDAGDGEKWKKGRNEESDDKMKK